MRRRTFLTMGGALAAAAGFAACSDDDSKGSDGGSGTPSDGGSEGTQGSGASHEAGTFGEAPTVTVPDGEPPKELQTEDLIVGDGDEAKAGDTISAHYTGVAWSTKEEFDSSWKRGEPLEFQLGAGMVIEGWDKGLEGMKVGGRRKIVIPPDMAYGEAGAPPAIGPDETLVFVCDLVEVTAGK